MANRLSYGAAFADVYDEWYGAADDIDELVSLLCELHPRRVLELGVGTGRIALPLAVRLAAVDACRVVGVDESDEMLSLLKSKDERGLVTVIRGDMVDDLPDETFDLVILSYNTLFNLDGVDRQRRCLANAAARLEDSGAIVIDACVIDELAAADGTAVERRGLWTLHTSTRFDARTGLLDGVIESRHDDGRVVVRPFHVVYSPPRTIDELCTSAGLRLEHRFGSWQRHDFHPDSGRHVSIYRLVR